MKVYCCIDNYRHGQFVSFSDFDNDHDFIMYLFKIFPDHFGEIVGVVYKDGINPHFDAGVVGYTVFEDEETSYQISRRYVYIDSLPF